MPDRSAIAGRRDRSSAPAPACRPAPHIEQSAPAPPRFAPPSTTACRARPTEAVRAATPRNLSVPSSCPAGNATTITRRAAGCRPAIALRHCPISGRRNCRSAARNCFASAIVPGSSRLAKPLPKFQASTGSYAAVISPSCGRASSDCDAPVGGGPINHTPACCASANNSGVIASSCAPC